MTQILGLPFQIVGFDLDGTLLDTSGDLAAALNHALSVAGRPAVTPQAAWSMIGAGTRTMLSRALYATGGPVERAQMDHLTNTLVTYYAAHIAQHTRPYPGCIAMLDALAARGAALAVVTNKLEHLAVKLLTEMGLADRFYTIIGGDTLGPGNHGTSRAKPAPDVLHEMLARAPQKGRAAFVGDTSFDVGAARAAGLPCVAVSFGFCDHPAGELGADAVIDHFDQLEAALERL